MRRFPGADLAQSGFRLEIPLRGEPGNHVLSVFRDQAARYKSTLIVQCGTKPAMTVHHIEVPPGIHDRDGLNRIHLALLVSGGATRSRRIVRSADVPSRIEPLGINQEQWWRLSDDGWVHRTFEGGDYVVRYLILWRTGRIADNVIVAQARLIDPVAPDKPHTFAVASALKLLDRVGYR